MTLMSKLSAGAAALALLAGPVAAQSLNGSADVDSSVSGAGVNADANVSAEADATTDPTLGERIDNAADATGEALQNGYDNTVTALENTGEAISEGTEDATDRVAADAEALTPTTLTAGTLVGANVIVEDGDSVGAIDNVVLVDGKEMAVIGIGGFLGIGAHDVALPLTELSSNEDGVWADGYTRADLEAMAEFDPEVATPINDDEPVMLGRS